VTTRTRLTPTFCRICEPLCPLIAETDAAGNVLALRPDRDHPVSHGFACHKGTSFAQVHHDPNRVDHPLRRRNPRSEPTGVFDRVSWDDAISGIGERLRTIRAEHGTEAVGCYWGNPLAYTSTGIATVYSFWAKMQSTRLFGGLTQDLSNKFAAMEAMFGCESVFPAPDLYHTDFFLCLGSDPSGSHLTAVSVPNALDAIGGIRARGGRVTFVNPRRIQAVELGLGEHLQIRPDTDLYFLAAMLNEIDRIGGWDEAIVDACARNVEGLRAFIAPFYADRVAGITGLDADEVRRTARSFAEAPSAIAHMGTGGNMGRQGTLVYWLLQMLNLLTGNLGRQGGGLLKPGLPQQRLQGELPDPFFDSPVGPVRQVWGHVPGNLLADYITAPTDPLRALIVVGGNPIMAIPGEERLRAAFPGLELVVTIDLYRSATAELSDYVLPASDWLERADLRSGGVAIVPTAQYTDAVVAPIGERAEEWWILARLEQELGLPSALDGAPGEPAAMIDAMLAAAGTSVDELRTLPSNTKVLPPIPPGSLAQTVMHADGRVDCCPSSFAPLLERAHAIFAELEAEPADGLKLIQWRNRRQHNTWGRRMMPSLRSGRFAMNPLYFHPDDAAARGFAEGDAITVKSASGSVDTIVGFDAALRRGVVALSHGYGERSADDADDAEVGVNVNQLLPSGPGSFETFSNMAHMVGIPVEVITR
jgi:anaerobic selenocysteine-containing dehydrogenase